MLLRLLRIIFHWYQISHDELVRRHSEFWHTMDYQPQHCGNDLNNLRRAILDKSGQTGITFARFFKGINSVLALHVKRVSITVVGPDGVERTFHSDTVVREDGTHVVHAPPYPEPTPPAPPAA